MIQSHSSISLIRSIRISQQELCVDGILTFSVQAENTDDWCAACYKHLDLSYPKFYKMDTMSKLGILASEFLLKDINMSEIDAYKRCMVLQNTASSLATDRKYAETLKTIPSPALFVYTLPNIVMGEIAIKHKIKGENTFLVSESFAPEKWVDYGSILFQDGVAELMICGFIDHTEADQDVLFCLLGKSLDQSSSWSKERIEAEYQV